jgi:type III secretory pathway component EscV
LKSMSGSFSVLSIPAGTCQFAVVIVVCPLEADMVLVSVAVHVVGSVVVVKYISRFSHERDLECVLLILILLRLPYGISSQRYRSR